MKRVFNLIIVDESSSMEFIREKAFSGMNETLQTIKSEAKAHPEVEQIVTLLSFSSEHVHFILTNKNGLHLNPIHWKDYKRYGATPLYDAIGAGISKVNAFCSFEDNVLVTIITDGEENCSREYSLPMIVNLIKKLKKQNWLFTFIGASSIDVHSISKELQMDACMSFSQDDKGTEEMFKNQNLCRSKFYNSIREGHSVDRKGFFEKKHHKDS